MDVTLVFNEYLSAKGRKPSLSEPFEVFKLNGFMVDAYRINTQLNELVRYLRAIRAPYLALQSQRNRTKLQHDSSHPDRTQPFTEDQRKLVDTAMKEQLTRIDKGIQELANVANLDLEVKNAIRAKKQQKRGFGLIRWAGGGADLEKSPEEVEEDARLETEKAHRDGVIWSLRMRLQHAGRVQEGMISTRVKREIERSQNILSKSRSERLVVDMPTMNTLSVHDLELENDMSSKREREALRAELESQMSPAQLQQLQAEETTMLKQYNAELEKIQRAQSSVLEISNLQTELTMHLNMQAENISQLVSDSFETQGNVKTGNEQLEKAKGRFRPAQWVFYVALGTGVFLVGWDLVF